MTSTLAILLICGQYPTPECVEMLDGCRVEYDSVVCVEKEKEE